MFHDCFSYPTVKVMCKRVTIKDPDRQSRIRFSLHPDSSHTEVCPYGFSQREDPLVGPTVTVKLADFLQDTERKSRACPGFRNWGYPHHDAIAAMVSGMHADDETKSDIVNQVIGHAEGGTKPRMIDRLLGTKKKRFDLNVVVKLNVTTICFGDDYYFNEVGNGGADDVVWMVPAAKGAKEGLEKVRFDVMGANRDDERQCVICYDDFEGESLVTRLGCSHVFHCDCLSEWLETSHYCPLCRFELPV